MFVMVSAGQKPLANLHNNFELGNCFKLETFQIYFAKFLIKQKQNVFYFQKAHSGSCNCKREQTLKTISLLVLRACKCLFYIPHRTGPVFSLSVQSGFSDAVLLHEVDNL